MKFFPICILAFLLCSAFVMLYSQEKVETDEMELNDTNQVAEIGAVDTIPSIAIFGVCLVLCIVLYFYKLSGSFVRLLEKGVAPLNAASTTLVHFILLSTLILLIWALNIPNMIFYDPIEILKASLLRVAVLFAVVLILYLIVAPHKKNNNLRS